MFGSKRVFLGVDNTAGICSRLKKGFDEIGVHADFYSYNQHLFGYKPDILIQYSDYRLLRIFQKIFLLTKLIIKYNYFIFLSTSTLLPKYRDIKLFKFFGKKTIIIFTGCDVRIPEKVMHFRWNPCRDCTQEYKDFVGCVIDTKKKRTRLIEKIFDEIICFIPDSGYLSREFHIAFSPINLTDFPAVKYNKSRLNSKLRILHAPTNQIYKGSSHIYKAIEQLRTEYDFDFKEVTNVPIETLYEEIEKSDLIIDQMIGGGYGLFAIEAMAMYKPVVCYIREDLWDKIKIECPIYNANPDNLYEILKKILKNPEQLIEAGKNSRKYVEDFHDSKKIAKQYLEILGNTN